MDTPLKNIKKYDFVIPNGDTDSISFCRQDQTPFTPEEVKELIQEMNDISPEFMDWEDDGYYLCVIVLKAKNYVLLKKNKKTGENEITLKGSGLKDAKKEPILKDFMNEVIDGILYEKNNVQEIYQKYVNLAQNITDIEPWAVKKTISKKLLTSERKNETDIVDAIPDLSQVREGDKIFIYKAVDGMRQVMEDETYTEEVFDEAKGKVVKKKVKTGKKVPAFHKVGPRKGQPKMEPNVFYKQTKFFNNDVDNLHYVGRVYSTLSIFKNVLDMSQFLDYSNPKNKLEE